MAKKVKGDHTGQLREVFVNDLAERNGLFRAVERHNMRQVRCIRLLAGEVEAHHDVQAGLRDSNEGDIIARAEGDLPGAFSRAAAFDPVKDDEIKADDEKPGGHERSGWKAGLHLPRR